MRKPSPSILVSSAALLVALGGTSYAAAQINGNQIQKNTVTGKQIKNGAVTSKDIKNKTIKAKDLKPGVVPTATRWVVVNAAGQIEAQSGGFTVAAPYPVLPNTATAPAPDNSLRANGNVYINANEPLNNNAITASLLLQNTVDQNADGIMNGRAPGDNANPEFSGEITASQCGVVYTTCAPPGTAVNNVFVVSPRLSNGGVTNDTNRKRFVVIISGDSSDFKG